MMNRHWKIFALILILTIAAGCSQKNSENDSDSDYIESKTASSSSEVQAPIETEEKTLPAIAVFLGSDSPAETYSVDLPFTLHVQLISPAVKGSEEQSEISEITIGSPEHPWWQDLSFEFSVDGQKVEVDCQILPGNQDASITFRAESYPSVLAAFQPPAAWQDKQVEVSGSITYGREKFTSYPQTFDFSASAPEQGDIDFAQFTLHINKGEYDAAKVIAQRLIDEDPQNHRGYSMMGRAAEEEGNIELAIKSYRSMIAFFDGQEENHDAIQFILMRVKELEEQIK